MNCRWYDCLLLTESEGYTVFELRATGVFVFCTGVFLGYVLQVFLYKLSEIQIT